MNKVQPTTRTAAREICNPANGSRVALPLRMRERRLLLLLGDACALVFAATITLRVWASARGAGTLPGLAQQYWPWLMTAGATWLAFWAATGAYDLRLAARLRATAPRIATAGGCWAVSYFLLFFALSTPPHVLRSLPLLPRLQPLRLLPTLFIALAAVATLGWRSLYALTLANQRFTRRILIVGAGWAGRTIAQALRQHADSTYQVVGFIDDDPRKQDTAVQPAASASDPDDDPQLAALRVLGDHTSLPALMVEHQVSTLVLAVTHDIDAQLFATLMDCLALGVEIIPMPLLYEELTGRVPVEHVGDNWYVALPLHHPGTGGLWPLMKRLFDIVASTLGLLPLALLLPFIALAIITDSPGPVFYAQERVGKAGRIFRLYKFRTMVIDAEKNGAAWAQENDPRVTCVGRVLRRTHLDELPQLYNILRGDMSMVGPRPERPEFVAQLENEIPFYRLRHAVRPGAAGWALIHQGYGASKEDALLKLQYDLYYIKHQSLWLDAEILLKTVLTMLSLRGR